MERASSLVLSKHAALHASLGLECLLMLVSLLLA